METKLNIIIAALLVMAVAQAWLLLDPSSRINSRMNTSELCDNVPQDAQTKCMQAVQAASKQMNNQ